MKRAAFALALVIAALVPYWVGNVYYVNIASQILIWAIFALGLNILVGYAGLVSLGHTGLFGVTAYTAAWLLTHGAPQSAAGLAGLALAAATAALFAVLSLRATGISFLMITLVLGQIFWGIAYRWVEVTRGDNGIAIRARPAPLGISLDDPRAFYWATFVVFLIVVAAVYAFVQSPLGVSLRGTRDQPRRMTTLGYNVWLIRFLAFLFSGLVTAVAGLFFLYYTKFVSPYALSLSTSATALLMVIAGGSGTLLGPIVGAALVLAIQYVASAYIERWNIVLGTIFVLIILFMPEGLVPGSRRLWRRTWERVS
jgi:branched-chain amino acid transport system permease protein